MAPKILILTGAPSSKSIDWEAIQLLPDFQASIAAFAGLPTPGSSESSLLAPTRDHAAWRSLALHRRQISPGISQPQVGDVEHRPADAQFLTLAGLTASYGETQESVDGDDLASQLYDQSLDFRDGGRPRHVLGASFTESESSFRTAPSNASSSLPDTSTDSDHVRAPVGNAAASWHLSDLEDIPNAAYLTSVKPQTMTVNIIAGIISISDARSVQTRWGTTVSLVEVVVGDETKSGFAVTLWLSSDAARAVVATLRRQDVVLMQNVALNVFRDKVYGQSLRGDATKIHLLHRRKLHDEDVAGHYSLANLTKSKEIHPQLEKTRLVREWVLHFVGGGVAVPASRLAAVKSWDKPPDDTQ